MNQIHFRIVSDSGGSAVVSIRTTRYWDNTPDHITTPILISELQAVFCRIFNDPTVVVRLIKMEKNDEG